MAVIDVQGASLYQRPRTTLAVLGSFVAFEGALEILLLNAYEAEPQAKLLSTHFVRIFPFPFPLRSLSLLMVLFVVLPGFGGFALPAPRSRTGDGACPCTEGADGQQALTAGAPPPL